MLPPVSWAITASDVFVSEFKSVNEDGQIKNTWRTKSSTNEEEY